MKQWMWAVVCGVLAVLPAASSTVMVTMVSASTHGGTGLAAVPGVRTSTVLPLSVGLSKAGALENTCTGGSAL